MGLLKTSGQCIFRFDGIKHEYELLERKRRVHICRDVCCYLRFRVLTLMIGVVVGFVCQVLRLAVRLGMSVDVILVQLRKGGGGFK